MGDLEIKNQLLYLIELGFTFSSKDQKLQVKGDLSKLDDNSKRFLKSNKHKIITLLQQQASRIDHIIEARGDDVDKPLSFAQQRLWLADRIDGSSVHYNVQNLLELKGEVDQRWLSLALTELIERHKVLRTCFEERDGKAYQVVLPATPVNMANINLQHFEESEKRAELERVAASQHSLAFDLSKDILLRVKLVHLATQHFVLMLSTHHIAFDGWSLGVFTRELSALYKAFLSKKDSPLLPLSIQYGDYAHWQRQLLQKDSLRTELDFWQDYLAGIPPVHGLPLDTPRPKKQTFDGVQLDFILDGQKKIALNALCVKYDVTLFMLLQTAFSVLLSRYGSSDDIVLGTPVAGRSQPEVADLIGCFVNTLVFRCSVDKKKSFAELLRNNKQHILDVFSHQHVPFEMLMEELKPQRSYSYKPLYQVVFALQNFNSGELTLPGISLSPYEPKESRLNPDYELGLHITEIPTGLACSFSANTAVFNQQTLDRIATYFDVLLQGVITNPEELVGCLPLLSEPELEQIALWNSKMQTGYESKSCVHQLFEEQVKNTPSAVAIQFGDEQLDYATLNTQANQLAHYLISQGVSTGNLVGLCVERSVAMIIGMLAIAKAGGAYVPIDPKLPEERLEYLLEDSDITLILTNMSMMSELPFEDLQIIPMDAGIRERLVSSLSTDNPSSAHHHSSQLMYVIYTSGSTGKPKGVMVEHHNVVGLVHGHLPEHDYLNITSQDIIAQASTASFDAATFEIWGALLNGAKIVYISKGVLLEPALLQAQIVESNITVLFLTTALVNQVAYELPVCFSSLRALLFGGEQVNYEAVQRIIDHGKPTHLLHVYGPTEATTFSTCESLHGDYVNGSRTIGIGGPMANVEAHILDDSLQTLPIGAVGELYLSGRGIARGYLGKAELTNEKFISFPWNSSEDRLYHTGDLVRWLPTGNIEFIGRTDYQVKVRGFRIELGEIEHQLMSYNLVEDALVTVHIDERDQSKRLVAYVVPTEGGGADTNQSSLTGQYRKYLQTKLPEHMIPAAIVLLQSLPLTPNGKVDRNSLPLPETIDDDSAAYEMPNNDIEESLCQLWAEILGISQVGRNDNFFSLGGDSIQSIRIVSQAKKIGLNFSVKDLFTFQTVGLLAEQACQTMSEEEMLPPFSLLNDEERELLGEDFTSRLEDSYPMSELQQGMVYHSQLEKGRGLYHDIFSYHLKLSWDESAFRKSLSFMVNQHPVLRTGFLLGGKRSIQQVYKNIELPLSIQDIRTLGEQEQVNFLKEWLESERRQGTDLTGPLFKVFIFQRCEQSIEFGLSFHHAVYDGWSNSTFISELLKHYQTCMKGQALPALQIDWIFKHFIAKELASLADNKARDYWVNMLDEAPMQQIPRSRDLANDLGHMDSQVYHSSNLKDLSCKLIALSQRLGVPLQSLLLAAHTKVLTMLSGQSRILTSVVINGRPETEGGDKGLGLFLNSMPTCFEADSQSWSELIQSVSHTMTESMQYRHYPLSAVQRDTGQKYNEVIFNYTHFHAYKAMQDSEETILLDGQGVEETNFDLDVNFSRSVTTDVISLSFRFNSSVYTAELIERIGQYYANVFKQIVTHPYSCHNDICLLTEEEQSRLLGNEDITYWNKPETIAAFFEEQVQATPHTTALVYEKTSLSYEELNRKANQVAHYLMGQGVAYPSRVAINLTRSIELIVAILGVLKAGATYVPMDADLPLERKLYIYNDADCEYLITELGMQLELKVDSLRKLVLDDPSIELQLNENSPGNLSCIDKTIKSDNLAYILYTSGSTGEPKGVPIVHAGLSNLANAQIRRFNIQPQSKVLQFASISFDASTSEWLMALLGGAELHMVSKASILSTRTLATYVHTAGITHITLPPALLPHLEKSRFKTVSDLIVAGESCPIELAQEWSEGRRFYNAYGPTEVTVCATIGSFEHGQEYMHIGKPIENIQVYVVDENLQLAPTGVIGELCVSGVGLSPGYVNQKELTAQKFVDNPFNTNSQSALYRTGDLVRLLSDGNIEYIARRDNQVKIRGHRVEINEIQRQLLDCDEIKDVVVIADKNKESHNTRLIAYLVLEDGISQNDNQNFVNMLRKYLQTKLPAYMVPAAYVLLTEIPVTPNGKVDVKHLPKPNSYDFDSNDFVAPRDEIETSISSIWKQLLQFEEISVDSNFFDAGGHSLLLIKLLSEINKQFSSDLSLADLTSADTIAKQATLLSIENRSNKFDPLVALRSSGQKAPIYMIPGLAGHAQSFRELASHITLNRTVYAFNPRGLNGTDNPLGSVKDAARYYLSRLLEHQPTGGFILLGYSLGASVALEMCEMMHKDGLQVPKLIVVDGYAHYPRVENKIVENFPSLKEVEDISGELLKLNGVQGITGFESVVKAQLSWNYVKAKIKLPSLSLIMSADSPSNLIEQWENHSATEIESFVSYGSHVSMIKGLHASKLGRKINNWCKALTSL